MQRKNKIILSAKYLIPVSSVPVKNGAVLVEGDCIKDIGPSDIIKTKYPEIPIRDFPDSILMPGLINAHIHLEYSALGPLTKQIDFIPWIKSLILRQKELSREEIISSVKKGIKALISSGVTSVGEVSRSGLSLDELKKSGLRGIYFNEFVAVDDKRLEHAVSELKVNFKRTKAKLTGSSLKAGVFPHSVYTLSTKSLEYISTFCKKNKVFCGIHAAESPYENQFIANGSGLISDFARSFQLESVPVPGKWSNTFEYLKDLRFIAPLTQLVHCVHLGQEAFPLLEKTKTGIVLCPRSNYLLKNEKFALRKALKYNLKIGLGTDSLASNYSFDMFEEIRQLKGNIRSPLINEKLIEMATLGGARVLGLENETGSLASGKKADIIALKIDRSFERFSPLNYIISAITSKNICFTMIDGIIKYDIIKK